MFIPLPEQRQLLQECQALILLHQQTALTNPSDSSNQNQIMFLQKVWFWFVYFIRLIGTIGNNTRSLLLLLVYYK